MRLPPAIERYIASENSGEMEPISECFAPDAVVSDEHRTYEGLASIKEWKAETRRKYNHTMEPLDVVERNGKTIVDIRLAGNFPGSPIVVHFEFVLKDGRIASLHVRG